MKKLFRVSALLLILGMLTALSCTQVFAVQKKIWVSHFNDTEGFSNESIIFTQEGIGNRTLGDLTANTVAVKEENKEVWNHLFAYYYTAVCVWDVEQDAYVVQKVSWPKSKGENEARYFTAPDNGFILAVHYEVYEGKPNTLLSSYRFAAQNLADESEQSWKSYLGQPIYLYNIDLSAEDGGLITSGSFYSAISPKGRSLGYIEVFENFSTESYVMIGTPDSGATVSPYRPSTLKLSKGELERLMSQKDYLDPLDYTQDSFQAFLDAYNAVDLSASDLTQKQIDEWTKNLSRALDNLQAYTGEDNGSTDGGNGKTDSGDNIFIKGDSSKEGNSSAFIILIIAIAAAVLVGGAFLFLLYRKKKNASPESNEIPKEPKEEITKKEESKEDPEEKQ